MSENTYNIKSRGVAGYDDDTRLTEILSEISDALSGDLVFVVTPATVTTAPTSAAWTRTVNIELQDSDGNVQDWFNKSIATGVSIADTSNAGTATIPSTTLEFVSGVASVVVTGSAHAWLGGTAQVESITCTAGESTGAGNITMTVTSDVMTGSPKAVVVAVAENDDVNAVGLALRTALAEDKNVAAFYTVGGSDATASLTAKTPAVNDTTLAFGFEDTGATGVTFGSSTNTTAGVAKETDTLTVAQASIVGTTVAAKTSVETFSA